MRKQLFYTVFFLAFVSGCKKEKTSTSNEEIATSVREMKVASIAEN